ncbi:hypothetical protein C8R43DRAFT_1109396 [Mycena crocata]|nr:hypothetical protein C8R43DRAFT_1109396 [Mycena crocata]
MSRNSLIRRHRLSAELKLLVHSRSSLHLLRKVTPASEASTPACNFRYADAPGENSSAVPHPQRSMLRLQSDAESRASPPFASSQAAISSILCLPHPSFRRASSAVLNWLNICIPHPPSSILNAEPPHTSCSAAQIYHPSSPAQVPHPTRTPPHHGRRSPFPCEVTGFACALSARRPRSGCTVVEDFRAERRRGHELCIKFKSTRTPYRECRSTASRTFRALSAGGPLKPPSVHVQCAGVRISDICVDVCRGICRKRYIRTGVSSTYYADMWKYRECNTRMSGMQPENIRNATQNIRNATENIRNATENIRNVTPNIQNATATPK